MTTGLTCANAERGCQGIAAPEHPGVLQVYARIRDLAAEGVTSARIAAQTDFIVAVND